MTPDVVEEAVKFTEGVPQVIVAPLAEAPGAAVFVDTVVEATEVQPLDGSVTKTV